MNLCYPHIWISEIITALMRPDRGQDILTADGEKTMAAAYSNLGENRNITMIR